MHIPTRFFATLSLFCIVGGPGAAPAGPPPPTDATIPGVPPECPVDVYKSLTDPTEIDIPDDGEIVLGPIQFSLQPGIIIADVVVRLEAEHSAVGDLTVTLTRFTQQGDVRSVVLVDRPGFPEDPTRGCRANLGDVSQQQSPYGVYDFGLGGGNPIGEPCPGDNVEIPDGCYLVDPASDPLAIFNGLPKGGTVDDPAMWALTVNDGQPGDNGRVYGWTVYLLCEPGPVSVDEGSWTLIKSRYRR